ncbi:citrate-binding protein-like [Durio zibethinus]|uniref:Citrate-binding protein-like n=1 Tax=Durio zibethinus TaxID=66656 RepID=A0A6P6B9W3_DURZI|nr:citrate-binding protein-like [Durio zibethinus]
MYLPFSSLEMAFQLLLSLLCLSQLISFQANAQQDPTSGFTAVSLSQSNFELQKPYDKSPNERYSFNNGEHRLWVFATDKPHTPSSNTKPRTEIRIRGYDYSSGVWQFEGQAYVPSGTTGTSIMQIFGGTSRATTIMLRVYTGSLTVYRNPVVLSNMYNRWFKVNVIHDVGASNVKVYIDGVLRYQGSGDGGSHHYFKFGVYAQNDESNYMESRWRGIRVLRRN